MEFLLVDFGGFGGVSQLLSQAEGIEAVVVGEREELLELGEGAAERFLDCGVELGETCEDGGGVATLELAVADHLLEFGVDALG